MLPDLPPYRRHTTALQEIVRVLAQAARGSAAAFEAGWRGACQIGRKAEKISLGKLPHFC